MGIGPCARRRDVVLGNENLSCAKVSLDSKPAGGVASSNLDAGGRNSAVECHLAKVDVDGSNPFARSIFFMAA